MYQRSYSISNACGEKLLNGTISLSILQVSSTNPYQEGSYQILTHPTAIHAVSIEFLPLQQKPVSSIFLSIFNNKGSQDWKMV